MLKKVEQDYFNTTRKPKKSLSRHSRVVVIMPTIKRAVVNMPIVTSPPSVCVRARVCVMAFCVTTKNGNFKVCGDTFLTKLNNVSDFTGYVTFFPELHVQFEVKKFQQVKEVINAINVQSCVE
jgi:hypothetical protein